MSTKTRAPRKTGKKTVSKFTTASPRTKTTVADIAPTEALDTPMKKRELVDLVVSRSGIKKKDAKPVVEAMLAVLGEALSNERELNLRPMGKVKINRTKDVANGRIIVAKIRQPKEVVKSVLGGVPKTTAE